MLKIRVYQKSKTFIIRECTVIYSQIKIDCKKEASEFSCRLVGIHIISDVMEEGPSCENDSCSGGQEFSSILCVPNVHNRIHRIPPLNPVRSQFNPFHTFTICFFKNHVNIVLSSGAKSLLIFCQCFVLICHFLKCVACPAPTKRNHSNELYQLFSLVLPTSSCLMLYKWITEGIK